VALLPAPALTLLYTKSTLLKQAKVNIMVRAILDGSIFDSQPLLNIYFGAGAASRCGFGSTKMIRFLAAPAPQYFTNAVNRFYNSNLLNC
jgi:hypothetical protein